MLFKEPDIGLLDLSVSLSEAVDLVSPNVANHHKQVAYIASSIAAQVGMNENQQADLAMAGALHDIGALSLEERVNALNFEDTMASEHAEIGYQLLKQFQPLAQVAKLIRYHHTNWNSVHGKEMPEELVPEGSHILHLADRISVLISPQACILEQVDNVVNRIKKYSGTRFVPEYVDAFRELSQCEYFWMDIRSPSINYILSRRFHGNRIRLTMDDLIDLAKIFARIIDFRSPLNATHSSGVATVAETLVRKVGFSELESKMMRAAGYFHDLGKLAVPPHILEKPGRLTEREFLVIKQHPYYTYSILGNFKELNIINAWASFHHERLDGSGYPFHLKEKDLPVGSQIMAVADVFTAISEDRPYRSGMNHQEAEKTLYRMVADGAINNDVVRLLFTNYEEINQARIEAQLASAHEYQNLKDPM
ncbi:HD-GYP domain-containing protein [Syntrophomonas erecta]